MLDAQGVIAVLRNEPARDRVVELMRGAPALGLSLAEVVDQMVRISDVPYPRLSGDLGLLRLSGLAIVSEDEGVARNAGRIRAEHYHRTRCPLSLGDVAAAATALDRKSPLATSDRALAAVVRVEGGNGHRPAGPRRWGVPG